VEPSGIRRWGFAPHITLLIPTFALDPAPHRLTLMLHCGADAPLPLAATAANPTLRCGVSPRYIVGAVLLDQ
jgi:hypothetical protein